MTTKPPQRPRKAPAKKKADGSDPIAAKEQVKQLPGLPPVLQVTDALLPNGQIVMQFVFTIPVDDGFVQAMSDNLAKRVTMKRTGIEVPKLVMPKGVQG